MPSVLSTVNGKAVQLSLILITIKPMKTSYQSDFSLSKNKKNAVTKGNVQGPNFQFSFTELISLQKNDKGHYPFSYEDDKGNIVTGVYQVITLSHIKRIDDDSGNVAEWTIKQVSDTDFVVKGKVVDKDGNLLYSL